MNRFVLSVCFVAMMAVTVRADDNHRSRRVRVATAIGLSNAKDGENRESRVKAAVNDAVAQSRSPASKCKGRCEGDLDDCRLEAMKLGQPLVVFVGSSCDGRANSLPDAVVACAVKDFTGDDQPKEAKRVVILAPGGLPESAGDKSRLYVHKTLPGAATGEEVAKAVAKFVPKVVTANSAPVDWTFISQ